MLDSDIKKYHEVCVALARRRFPHIKDVDLLEGAIDVAIVYALQHWKDGAGMTFVGYTMLVATREIWKTMAQETPDLCLEKRAKFMRGSRGKASMDSPPSPFRDLARIGEPRTELCTNAFGVVPERMDVEQYLDAAGKYRYTLELRYIRGLKLGETAKVLGISKQATLTRISRGLDKIRHRFAIHPD